MSAPRSGFRPFPALRRRWPLLVGLPLAVLAISLIAALLRPPVYAAKATALVSRPPDPALSAGVSPDGADTAALDLPTILQSAAFQHDLAAELAARGMPQARAELSASAGARTLNLTAEAESPQAAIAAAEATIDLIRRNGLRYWGDPNATQARPGLLVSTLDAPETARRVNGLASVALEVALRTAVALGAAAGLALLDARLGLWPAGRAAEPSNQPPGVRRTK